jgi:hypothetical protein
MSNAVARIAGCGGASGDPNCGNPTGAGVGNGRIDQGIGAIPSNTVTNEDFLFFNHMRVADVITGLTGNPAITNGFGGGYPSASIGGGFTIGHTAATGGLTFAPPLARAGHYLVLTGSMSSLANTAGTGALTASQAARIDRKLDDGGPNSGSVVGINGGASGTCASDTTATASYNEALVAPLCNIAVRIQG